MDVFSLLKNERDLETKDVQSRGEVIIYQTEERIIISVGMPGSDRAFRYQCACGGS